jgi:hypothetical protein
MTGSSLVRINQGYFVSMDGLYSIQYFCSNGSRAWVISSRRTDGYFAAIDHAPTLDAAQTRYFELVAA